MYHPFLHNHSPRPSIIINKVFNIGGGYGGHVHGNFWGGFGCGFGNGLGQGLASIFMGGLNMLGLGGGYGMGGYGMGLPMMNMLPMGGVSPFNMYGAGTGGYNYNNNSSCKCNHSNGNNSADGKEKISSKDNEHKLWAGFINRKNEIYAPAKGKTVTADDVKNLYNDILTAYKNQDDVNKEHDTETFKGLLSGLPEKYYELGGKDTLKDIDGKDIPKPDNSSSNDIQVQPKDQNNSNNTSNAGNRALTKTAWNVDRENLDTYTVENNDTWYGIVAAKYDVTNLSSSDIKKLAYKLAAYNSGETNTAKLNDIENGKIPIYFKVGETLKLPKTLNINGKNISLLENSGKTPVKTRANYKAETQATVYSTAKAPDDKWYVTKNGAKYGKETYPNEKQAKEAMEQAKQEEEKANKNQ